MTVIELTIRVFLHLLDAPRAWLAALAISSQQGSQA